MLRARVVRLHSLGLVMKFHLAIMLHDVRSLVLTGILAPLGCIGEPGGLPTPAEYMPEYLSNVVCQDISDKFVGVNLRREADCCSNPPIISTVACGDVVLPYLEASLEAGLNAGLKYSPNCFEAMLGQQEECPNLASGSFLRCEDDCQIFSGSQPQGAQCESVGHRMSDCQKGLVCGADRFCHDPCELAFVAPEGGFCGPARGMWFVGCDLGLACAEDGTCQPAPLLGATCDSMNPCVIGGWCDATNSCVADFPGGSSCTAHDQCSSDICKNGECFEPESFACARWAW